MGNDAKKEVLAIENLSFCVTSAGLLHRIYANVRLAGSLLAEYYRTVYQCKEGVILTHTYIVTRIVNRTSLTNDDVACFSELTTEKFNAKSFAL
jgi:hypothetical protein